MQTERLIGERPSLERLDEFAAIVADERVGATLGGTMTRDQAERWIRRDIAHWEAHDFGAWLGVERASGELVAHVGAQFCECDNRPEIELLWFTRPASWGRGYAAEMAAPAAELVFSKGFDSVVAFTLPDNTSSRRVMEKLGMAYERDITHADLPHVLYRLQRPPE